VYPIFSKAAPDGQKAVVIEEKECDLGLGLNDAFIDIVIQPTAPDAREEQILRIQIPKHPEDLQVHWAGNDLLVIHPPKEPLKQEIRSWFPSVKVRVR